MRKTLVDITYRGQPVYEEWNEAKTELRWYSREVTGDYPKNWRFAGWLPLGEFKVKAGITRAQIAQARARLLRKKGVEALVS